MKITLGFFPGCLWSARAGAAYSKKSVQTIKGRRRRMAVACRLVIVLFDRNEHRRDEAGLPAFFAIDGRCWFWVGVSLSLRSGARKRRANSTCPLRRRMGSNHAVAACGLALAWRRANAKPRAA